MIVDTHAHLYATQFDEDRDEMMQRAAKNGVKQIFLPNIDHTSIDGMLAMEAKYPKNCYAMMGLHPCSVKENYKEELAIVESWLQKRKFCAVGEIGMDFHWDTTFVKEQEDAFRTQINWAKELDIPIVIHSRKSTDEIIDIVKEEKTDQLRGIFHCFGGTVEQAQSIIDLGFHLGIGGVLTFKKSGLDKVLETIDLKHLVLETDSPYLAPTPHRGKRNETAYTLLIAEKLAAVKGLSLEEVSAVTTANALSIFKVEEYAT